MGWLRKILKGSASNSRIQSNNNEDGDWDKPCDLSDEALDSEREETHYTTTLSSAEENEAEEDQESDDGQSETGDEQYYKASHLVNEDERIAEALPQSLVFNSNPLWEIENIFPHFPFSFYSEDRQRSNESCEDDERCSSANEPNNAEDESTESEEQERDYQIAHIRSFSEDGQVILIQINGEGYSEDDLYGEAWTKDWIRYEELKSEHEDDQPTLSFQQNMAFALSSPFDIANISPPFPFSFYPDNGSQWMQMAVFCSVVILFGDKSTVVRMGEMGHHLVVVAKD
ncbi:uncharacterized protein LOC115686098 [Syzygium oleosum]|uniref:uncharacterized protein LOC115686098 n=1 Tax=Syzygium oleosum TaxID=219896 RepID=UPI0024BB8D28|nr:uncharacterized protein LOC115686098 [Syzygium oleosum]